jgi:hypothetical protein
MKLSVSGEEGIFWTPPAASCTRAMRICRRLQISDHGGVSRSLAPKRKLLIARYLSDPKPVLWGDQFVQRPGESAKEAVARCYPQLIAHRKKLYEHYAHRIVSLERAGGAKLDARGFLELLDAQARPA